MRLTLADAMRSVFMKRYISGVMVFLAAMLVSCGGGGGGGGDSSSGTTGSPGGSPGSPSASPGSPSGSAATRASAGMHVEESDPAVTLSGAWTTRDPQFGWSGGSA